MLPRFPRSRTCLCGFKLETGAKIIAYFSLVGNLFGGFCRVLEWEYVKPNFDFGPIQDFVCLGTAILSFALVFCACMLLGAAYNKSRMLTIPWLVCDMLLRCIHIVGLVYCILFAVAFQGVAYNSWTIVLTFFAVCIFIGIILGTYFWWVVLNYFLELREIEILVAKRNVNWTLSSQLDIV